MAVIYGFYEICFTIWGVIIKKEHTFIRVRTNLNRRFIHSITQWRGRMDKKRRKLAESTNFRTEV